RGGALRIPGNAFVAHVLHAYRTPEVLRQHRRVGGGVALIIAAVGAGAEHPDPVHLVPRQAREAGPRSPRVTRPARPGANTGPAVAHVGDRTGRASARMRLDRIFVLAFDDADGPFDAFLEIAVLALELALDDRRPANVREQLVVAREIGLGVGPGDLERLRCLH